MSMNNVIVIDGFDDIVQDVKMVVTESGLIYVL